jgi:hypothetical protein
MLVSRRLSGARGQISQSRRGRLLLALVTGPGRPAFTRV